MKNFRTVSLALSLLATVTIPATAGVNIISPGNGSTVGSSFTVDADASTCSSQPVTAMGFSLDSGGDIAVAYTSSIKGTATSGRGTHVVHVKAWGDKGSVCVADATVTVTAGSSAVPAGALSVSNIQTLGSWTEVHDGGTGGKSGGVMSMVGWPSRSGSTRRFSTSYTGHSGERYTASFGDDAYAQNFFYDAWVYIEGGSDTIYNLEMDMNQVMPNGQTAIYGVQCDGYTNTWDFTTNKGTPQHPSDQWIHSKGYCNPRGWGKNHWHHVQILYSRDGSGNVCYKSVWLDGNQQNFYVTVPSAFALGWAPTILTNFQVDGYSPNGWSTANVYLDDLTIYRW